MKRKSIIISFVMSVVLIGCLLSPISAFAGCSCQFRVYNVRINGSYEPVPIFPVCFWPVNQVIVEFDYLILNPSSCTGCLRQLVIGVDNIDLECIEVEKVKGCWYGDELRHVSKVLNIPYHSIKSYPELSSIFVKDYAQYDCDGAKNEYRRNSPPYCNSELLAKIYKCWW